MPLDNIINAFQILYQEIFDLAESGTDPVEKWTKVASLLHNRSTIVPEIFNLIRKEPMRKEISLDYTTNAKQLNEQIKKESDALVKTSFIITALHHIIYDLLGSKGNYFFSLDGPKEMHVLKKPLVYYVNMSVKNEQNIYFHAFILLVALESLFNKHFYIGIDFEYTNKQIQLAQLNFEHNISMKSIIMMVSPAELEPVMMEHFINLIICNKNIKKILHGADSLDIPYVYEHMLGNDPNRIIRFTRTMIDTRFLCEYYKLNYDISSDNRCAIYDEDATRSAIFYFSLISKEQQDKLTELLGSMPAPHDIKWNIHKMPESQILYAQYDVIFLKYFYYRIIYVATEHEQTDAGKKIIIDLYKHVLVELTQFVLLERRGISFLLAKCKEEVDPINNFMVRKQNGILKLKDIFDQVSVGLVTAEPRVEIDRVIKVNYFGKPIMTIVKKMVYTIISQKCRVHKDKMTVWTDKLDNQFIFDLLEKMNYRYLLLMFKDIEQTLRTRIKNIC